MMRLEYTTVVSLPVCLLIITMVSSLVLGCEPLHRDSESVWGDDVGLNTDTAANGPEDAPQLIEDAADRDTPQPIEDATNGTEDTPQPIEDTASTDTEDDVEACVPGGECGACDQGELVCDDEDQLLCQGSVNLDTDLEHCGDCHNQCSTEIDDATARCENGECLVECAEAEKTACEEEGLCVDPDNNIEHCGECDNPCPIDGAGIDSTSCEAGECIINCEEADFSYCEEAGACVDLQSDDAHCGQCGTSCPGNQCCIEGTCSGGQQC